MRREWSGWIKARQWGEFEKLAKTEPNQALADVVAELERGFPDKPDRKALKKVLFLLAQAGYRPQPIEIEEEESSAPEAPFTFGYLVSADGRGDAVVSYGMQEGKRVRWLVCHINGARGVTDAAEEDFSLDESHLRVKRLMESAPKPFVSAPIAPELAIGMVADAVARTKGTMPPVVAYWRSRLRDVEMPPHPGETLPREETDERARRRVPMMMDATLLWRLELGVAAPLLRDLYEAQMDEALSEDEKNERTDAALAAARETAFTPDILRDHEQRLLNLAYVLHLRGEEGSGTLLNTLDDLRAKGPQSDYAIGMMDKTVVLLAETLRESAGSRPE
ncbi:MAG: hypothetical protein ACO1SV_25555 [Fimbriimonas sp.]